MSQIARRQLIAGLTALPLAPVLPLGLAAVLSDPRRARAAAQGLEEVSLTTRGGRSVTAALALPEKTPAPAVLLVHEFWGLNDQIKSVAAELAGEGYVALAVDLYGGAAPPEGDVEAARTLARSVEAEAATDTLVSWMAWLREQEKVSGGVATLGWCFGGGWALRASVEAPAEATVVYYGRVNLPAEELKKLQGPVLGHFGSKDKSINEEMVGAFERAMVEAGRDFVTHWYVADHAFANPTTARYDEEDAALAWSRTLAFLARHLKG